MRFSIIIPVYNRPSEIKELLDSLTKQYFGDFEVILVEDGSTQKCDEIASEYAGQLTIKYFFKENAGQGFARNYGMERATGEYFVMFDSDCVIPKEYLLHLDEQLKLDYFDAHGGADRADEHFTVLQKAISYSMTSVLTTGGIRGSQKAMDKFHPRGFNMGFKASVFEQIGGFIDPRMGEDVELSIRIRKSGFRVAFLPEAYVYHKRRNTLWSFAKQAFSFGRNRINIRRFHPEELKLVHLLPFFFLLACLGWLATGLVAPSLFYLGAGFLGAYLLALFLHSVISTKQLSVGLLSVFTAFIQLNAYGLGIAVEGLKLIFGSSKSLH